MALSNFYLTDAGNALLARAQIGTLLKITRCQVGEGFLQPGTTYANVAAMDKPVKYMNIEKMESANGQTKISIIFDNSGVGRAFGWSECGLWAEDPDYPGDRSHDILFGTAYAASAAEAVPIPAALTQFRYNILLKTGSASNVSVVISESMVYVTREEFESAMENTGGGIVIIPLGETIPVSERKPGFLYFQVKGAATLAVTPEVQLKFGE